MRLRRKQERVKDKMGKEERARALVKEKVDEEKEQQEEEEELQCVKNRKRMKMALCFPEDG